MRPLLAAILRHPHLYDPDRRMSKPPVVQAAGMLRATGRGVDTTAWSWLCDQAGQMLFEPPNVSGWNDSRWLDTATFRARWQMAAEICNRDRLDADEATARSRPNPAKLVTARRRVLGPHAALAPHAHGARALRRARAMATANERWERDTYPVLIENALRMLVAVSPDYLTS